MRIGHGVGVDGVIGMRTLLIALIGVCGLMACRLPWRPEPVAADGVGERADARPDAVHALNGVWAFRLMDADATAPADWMTTAPLTAEGWSTITVPANWEPAGFAAPRFGRAPQPRIGLYRRTFDVAEPDAGGMHLLRFEGVASGFECWLNGAAVGRGAGAWLRHEFDVTPHIRAGSNVLAVRVTRDAGDAAPEEAWTLSGIHRDVEWISRPPVHIAEWACTTRVTPDCARADVTLDVLVRRGRVAGAEPVHVYARLGGDAVGAWSATRPVQLDDGATTAAARLELAVESPRLWPEGGLYDLQLVAQAGVRPGTAHSVQGRIGLREVSVAGGELRVNHRPIKLRGVNWLEIHPEVGRALRTEHWRVDVTLMKRAHINMVRVPNPPHPGFLRLCDEAGLYVLCGLPLRQAEARRTVQRDRNRASVIMWTIGDGEPTTDTVDGLARAVKQLDPTRPIAVPQRGEDFSRSGFGLPPHVDVLAPQYPTPEQLREWARRARRPIVATEYAHALGECFEGLQDLWPVIEAEPRLAGGAVWQWCDRTLNRAPGRGANDGIVHADRSPQPDYHLVQAVYGGTGRDAAWGEPANRFAGMDDGGATATVRRQFMKDAYRFDVAGLVLVVDRTNGAVRMLDGAGRSLILDGPFVRVGRPRGMAERIAAQEQYATADVHWQPHVLTEPRSVRVTVAERRRRQVVQVDRVFDRPGYPDQAIELKTWLTVSPGGWVDVDYEYTLMNAEGILLEAGLAFHVPAAFQKMYWIGDGPWPAYPGQNAHVHFGRYCMPTRHPEFAGNRANVELMMLTGGDGAALTVLAHGADLVVERDAAGMGPAGEPLLVLGHNAAVSGRGTRMHATRYPVWAREAGTLNGGFRLCPNTIDGHDHTAYEYIDAAPLDPANY